MFMLLSLCFAVVVVLLCLFMVALRSHLGLKVLLATFSEKGFYAPTYLVDELCALLKVKPPVMAEQVPWQLA